MPTHTPTELAERLGSGLLSFPVTHFTPDLAFDETAYRDNIARMSKYDIAALFAASGTGEFFSLTPQEVGTVLRAAVESAPPARPSSPRPGTAPPRRSPWRATPRRSAPTVSCSSRRT
ncbi:dihydrodipicolinate synthase family protein [Actinomadura keratinilytica]